MRRPDDHFRVRRHDFPGSLRRVELASDAFGRTLDGARSRWPPLSRRLRCQPPGRLRSQRHHLPPRRRRRPVRRLPATRSGTRGPSARPRRLGPVRGGRTPSAAHDAGRRAGPCADVRHLQHRRRVSECVVGARGQVQPAIHAGEAEPFHDGGRHGVARDRDSNAKQPRRQRRLSQDELLGARGCGPELHRHLRGGLGHQAQHQLQGESDRGGQGHDENVSVERAPTGAGNMPEICKLRRDVVEQDHRGGKDRPPCGVRLFRYGGHDTWFPCRPHGRDISRCVKPQA